MEATNTFSRRRIMAAMGALPVAALAAPAIGQAPAVDRREWDQAFAAMERARAASDADDLRHEPIWQRFNVASEAVPHVTLTSTDPNPLFQRTLTTASYEDVWEAKRPGIGGDHYADLCRRIVSAADARDAEISRIGERLGYFASAEQQEAMCEAFCAAEAALIAMPAPDRPALLWKAERLFGPEPRGGDDGSCPTWCAEWTNAFMADVRRLLSGEA